MTIARKSKTVTEWGVRFGDGSVAKCGPGPGGLKLAERRAEEFLAQTLAYCVEHGREPGPQDHYTVVERTKTTVVEVTDWIDPADPKNLM